MRKMLNCLYITNPHLHLSKDGENIVIKNEQETCGRFPIHILESIVCMNYTGMSPGLMQLCVEHGVSVSFMTPTGRLCARLAGPVTGNVLLRRAQYRWADDVTKRLEVSKIFVLAKIINQRKVVDRGLRDHRQKLDEEKLLLIKAQLTDGLHHASATNDVYELLGYEGECARAYFSGFNDLVLSQKDAFQMQGRTRRPPLDPINALLSFAYGLLRIDMQNALETVGLDPYVGFYHTDRPGRASLALDMMEELRPYIADRFVLRLINRDQIHTKDFYYKENGAVLLTDEGSKIFLNAWNKRRQEELIHPYLDEKIPIGLLPYAQAMLMARHVRGDLGLYPPFFIK